MAGPSFIAGVVTVKAKATLVCQLNTGNDGILVQNTGSVAVLLGGPEVTASTGYPLAAKTSIVVPSVGGHLNELFAITESGETTVAFLYPQ
jgi:hypothetical protein